MSAPPPPPPTYSKSKPAKKWAPVDTSSTSIGFTDGTLGTVDMTAASADVDTIDWTTLVGMERAEGLMTSPVAFVATSTGLTVIKAGKGLAQEYFASLLAPICGAKVPQCRVVLTSSAEFESLRTSVSSLWYEAVERSLRLMNFSSEEQLADCRAHMRWSDSYFERQFCHEQRAMLVFEYVRRASGELKLSREALVDVGALVVLDALLVNKDRFPLYTLMDRDVVKGVDLRGISNLGNMLVRAKDGAVVGIDQAANALTGEAARDAACSHLTSLLDDVPALATRLVALFTAGGFSLVDGDEDNAALILTESVRSAMRRVVAAIDSVEVLDELKRSVERALPVHGADPIVVDRLNRDLEQICPKFIWRLTQILKSQT